MGISGLLPTLKSIQITKHLSEFAGQTLAVDAYVWLHKGVFTCATELATGKTTHKYVDYAMHRVRLLRHHHIEPYIVFDGGPLPAKKGTEVGRQQKREESLARGNALAAQGKHNQAREYYVKCVDVTPQMAFQLIKALRAEFVPYVVAPYEADAQLTYLERIGLVDGIITEDSDLLVFGCRTVLFKFDAVASTVVSVSRADFASVRSSTSNNNSISLIGWSDLQFRAMAILSGCDYLPSIPGVGLKTAYSLLKKWKTVEQVVRVLMLEGKKSVPAGYLKAFRLAEKCFLHQRVYCPRNGRLVHLTEVDGDWSFDAEEYVGSNLDDSIAKKIALGDIDPVTLLPMDDIDAGFVPRPLKFLAPDSNEYKRPDKGIGKVTKAPQNVGILSFFDINPRIPHRDRPKSQKQEANEKGAVGKASGKRTLAEVMERDSVEKRMREPSLPKLYQSKFFDTLTLPRAKSSKDGLVVGPSFLAEDKENICILIDDDDEPRQGSEPVNDLHSDISMEVQGGTDIEMPVDLDEPLDAVDQEDGYISPTPSCSRDTQDLSSPSRPGNTLDHRQTASKDPIDNYFDIDAVSSPLSGGRRLYPPAHSQIRSLTSTRSRCGTEVCVAADNSLVPDPLNVSCILFPGPDLRSTFIDDQTSEIDCFEDEKQDTPCSDSLPTRSLTPIDLSVGVATTLVDDGPLDPQVSNAQANELRKKAVITGWRERWALNNSREPPSYGGSPLKRKETNVTPMGRHSAIRSHTRLHPYPQDAPYSAPSKTTKKPTTISRPLQTRKSLPLFEAVKVGGSKGPPALPTELDPTMAYDTDTTTLVRRVQSRLEQFRYSI